MNQEAQNAPGELELAQVIETLRSEIQSAVEAGAGERLRFDLGPIQVKLSVAVTREGGAEGKVKFWVIEAGGSGKWSREQTQEITISLTPIDSLSSDGKTIVDGPARTDES